MGEFIGRIIDEVWQLMPLFRVMWLVTISMGTLMVIVAILLKRDSSRKKSPIVFLCVGILMIVSSGIQLLASLF